MCSELQFRSSGKNVQGVLRFNHGPEWKGRMAYRTPRTYTARLVEDGPFNAWRTQMIYKESPPGTTAKLEKESEEILDRWASKESSFRKLARDLWAWLNTHTRLASLRALLAPEVTEPPTDFRSVCPRTGKVRDGDLKYAGSCGGWQCTHHTCTGASCTHCGGTGRCPEKSAAKK